MSSSSRQHAGATPAPSVTHSRGWFAEQIRSAVGRDERASAWGAALHAIIVAPAKHGESALNVLAGRIGTGRSRVYKTLVGNGGFWLPDVAALEEHHARAVLELLAEVLGYRVVPVMRNVQGGELAAHVQTISAGAAVIAGATTAAADGVYDRHEATPLRGHVQRLRESLEWLDGLLAEAEATGTRGVA